MSDSTPSAKAAVPTRPRRWSGLAAIVLSLLAIVGITVRLTIQDHYRLPAIIFYMLSPASITGISAVAWMLCRRARNRSASKAMLLITLFSAAWIGMTMFYVHPQQPRSDATVRVMFWNVFRGYFGWDSIVRSINEEDPDLIVLAEVAKYRLPEEFWDNKFPDHTEVVFLPREVVVLSKYPVIARTEHHQSWKGSYQRLQLRINDQDLNLLIADVPSPPAYKRDQPIGLIEDMAAQYADGPAMLVGDFNTPVDSVFLNPIRNNYRHAFEVTGNGYLATWPMPAPVIAIDHCWVSKHIEVTACKIKWTIHSDHRPIVTDVTISKTANSE